MKIRSAVLLLILLAPSSLFSQTEAARSKPLAITNVTVIDMADAPPGTDMTVIVVGNRIAAFGNGIAEETLVYRASITKPLLDSFSEEKARSLFDLFVRKGTWQTPTLATLKGLWNRDDLQDADIRFGEQMKRRELDLTKAMHRAGVGLLAGTDGPPDRTNLHDELAMFVQAGLSPKEALRTATINPAKYFRRQKSLGAIERGKIADMVLLEANPLVDIGNAKRIAAVVINGRYLPKDSLQKMLAETESAPTKKE